MADMRIKGVVFDFGGVLSDPTNRIEVMSKYEKILGMPEGRLQEILFSGPVWEAASTGKITIDEFWSRTGKQFEPYLPPEFEELKEDPFAMESLVPEMVDLVEEMSKRYKVGLCSNALPSLEAKLKRYPDLLKCFSVVVISAEVGLRKPDPRIYELTARLMQLSPEEIVFIDDKERNTRAAEEVGMIPCLHQSYRQTQECLEKLGVL
jgi:epoxide hydrolase-like predicted phosphatase